MNCPVCGRSLTERQRYDSAACKQRAYRFRELVRRMDTEKILHAVRERLPDAPVFWPPDDPRWEPVVWEAFEANRARQAELDAERAREDAEIAAKVASPGYVRPDYYPDNPR